MSNHIVKADKGTTNNNSNTSNNISNLAMTSDEETIFNLVNNVRKEAGLSELKLDKELLDSITQKLVVTNNKWTYGKAKEIKENVYWK